MDVLTTDRLIIGKLIQRIRDEYEEMPGLDLSLEQAARLWALDLETCQHVLARLHDLKFLVRTADGRYRRPSAL